MNQKLLKFLKKPQTSQITPQTLKENLKKSQSSREINLKSKQNISKNEVYFANPIEKNQKSEISLIFHSNDQLIPINFEKNPEILENLHTQISAIEATPENNLMGVSIEKEREIYEESPLKPERISQESMILKENIENFAKFPFPKPYKFENSPKKPLHSRRNSKEIKETTLTNSSNPVSFISSEVKAKKTKKNVNKAIKDGKNRFMSPNSYRFKQNLNTPEKKPTETQSPNIM